MREGFNELVEGYVEMLREEFPDNLAEVVLEELEATYELSEQEINYVRMCV